MSMMHYCRNMLTDSELQNELEKRVKSLLDGPLKGKSDYAKEKCINSYCETIVYLSKLEFKKMEDSPCTRAHHGHFFNLPHEDIKRVRKIVIAEMDRLLRNYMIFLT